MKKINSFDVPESWDELTFGDYVRTFKGVENAADDTQKTIKLIANILDVPTDKILELPAQDVSSIIQALSFISKPVTTDSAVTISLAGKIYKVVAIDKMSYRQYINCENESKAPDNLPKFVANILVDESGNYDPEDIEIICGLLLKKPVKDVIELVNFFSGEKNA